MTLLLAGVEMSVSRLVESQIHCLDKIRDDI